MQKKIRVLSLFDGISCAQVALKKIRYKKIDYFSSETDERAIRITNLHHPNTIQLGDIREIDGRPLKMDGEIDLLIGGSPCQDLSIAKRDRKGLSGSKSNLFYEFVRVLNAVKPKYFILENVYSMSKETKDIITKEMGVKPIMIDAGLVSGQSRKRLFWTNIDVEDQPKDKKLFLKNYINDWAMVEENIKNRMMKKKKGTLAYEKTWANVRTLDQKAKTITASGQCIANSGATNVKITDDRYISLSPEMCEELQGLPRYYTEFGTDLYFRLKNGDYEPAREIIDDIPMSKTQRNKMLGNAFNVDVIAHILKYMKI